MDVRREVAAAGGSKRIQKEKENTMKKQMVSRRMNAADDQESDVNEMADAFIIKFRNQLKIQREESFKRFQDMIARGV
ncbi:hypothetical protein D8674_007230 [Pyrus ussuriensis x Pyrus communis]|uniref:Uncharacterized protein n=1 Tax=Pyrus ussuriensis x Pyrus communis TaxID=2448454 RepID=A0A5N5FWS3_9ROSA|nr:hypothetical protein D8674_007230 [Pyrus ussuriensis x Pyrus communis]